jgi:hypothetical protein
MTHHKSKASQCQMTAMRLRFLRSSPLAATRTAFSLKHQAVRVFPIPRLIPTGTF